ncbi:MAG: hypothetical protein R2863_12300 [Candidatus Kapaibacterium sp.]|nr:hypothetical protein [Ignavibacteriota bacterium]MCB9221744.1 hypothetical protein [Ignavibacteria bacterium]
MKFITLHIGDSKIELYNTLLGKETIIVDGQKISEKYSITGANHRFTIIENGQEKHAQLNTKLTLNGGAFDLYVDNKPIIEIPESNGSAIIFFFGIVILAAALIFIN